MPQLANATPSPGSDAVLPHPLALDRQLGAAARKRGFGKSLMLREIVISWLTYERAKPTGRTAEEILDGE